MQRVPVAVPLLRMFYGNTPSDLAYQGRTPGDRRVYKSSQGSDQGCVYGGPTFAIGLRPTLDDLAEHFPDVLSLALHDDMNLVGPVSRAAAALTHQLRPDGPFRAANMRPSPSKPMVVWSAAPLSDDQKALFPAGYTYDFVTDGIVIHGLPHGTDAYVVDKIAAAVRQRQDDLHAAADARRATLADVPLQQGLLGLRVGVNARFNNLMRCVPPRLVRRAANDWDAGIMDFLQRIVGDTLPPQARTLASLPLRDGGVGLLSAALLTDVAYLSGWLACRSNIFNKFPMLQADLADIWERAAAVASLDAPADHIDVERDGARHAQSLDLAMAYRAVCETPACRDLLRDLLGSDFTDDVMPLLFHQPDAEHAFKNLQKHLSDRVHKAAKATLHDGASAADRAWFKHKAGTGATTVYTALPGIQSANRISDQHMRRELAAHLRLDWHPLSAAGLVRRACPHRQASVTTPWGSRTYVPANLQRETCATIVDPKGDHLLACRTGGNGIGRTARHNGVVHVLGNCLQDFPGSSIVRGDLKCAAWMTAQAARQGASGDRLKIPDLVLDLGDDLPYVIDVSIGDNDVCNIERDKITQYKSALSTNVILAKQLVIFAFNTAGELSPQADQFLSTISKRRAALCLPRDVDQDSRIGKRRLEAHAAALRAHMLHAVACTLVREQAKIVYRAMRWGYERLGLYDNAAELLDNTDDSWTGAAPREWRVNASWSSAVAGTSLVSHASAGFCPRHGG